MAPGSSKSAGKRKYITAKSKAKPAKGIQHRSSKNAAPERQLPDAVRVFAEKRKVIEIADDDSDEGIKKPAKKRKKPASTYDDFVSREMPIPRDYGAGFAAKSTANLTWGAPMVFRPLAEIKSVAFSKATAPSKAKDKSRNRRKGKRAVSPNHPFLSDSEEDHGTSNPEPRKMTAKRAKTSTSPDVGNTLSSKIFFMKFPTEIRMAIYRHLLVSEDPIQVRQGWSTLYPRNRPCLETSILRVSREVRNEAINILYGENVFLYLLRETATLPETDDRASSAGSSAGSSADDHFVEYSGESDPEYDEEVPVTAGNRDPKVEIDIKRFGHKFRRLKILAEPNRYEMGYLLSMANAISVFRNLKPIKCRIHTIEIEVTPKRDRDTGELTFLDFFDQSSAVMKELRGLPAQFIEITVNTSSDTQERIVVNLKYAAIVRRALRGEHPLLKENEAIQQYTKGEAGVAQRKLDNLRSSIEDLWKKQNGTAEKEVDQEHQTEQDDSGGWLWGQDYD